MISYTFTAGLADTSGNFRECIQPCYGDLQRRIKSLNKVNAIHTSDTAVLHAFRTNPSRKSFMLPTPCRWDEFANKGDAICMRGGCWLAVAQPPKWFANTRRIIVPRVIVRHILIIARVSKRTPALLERTWSLRR